MGKMKFELQNGETILLKEACVRHGFWGAYTDELVLTSQCFIHIKLGIFGNKKDVIRYPFSEISQVIIGEASNGEKQLEVYCNGKMEDFAFQSDNERTLKLWHMAITDRYSEKGQKHDFNYYQSFTDESLEEILDEEEDNNSDSNFLRDVAKNIIKSKNFSVGGVAKSVAKASKKKAFGGITEELKDDLGINDIKEEFTEIGNEFREAFGFKPKLTERQKKQKKLEDAFNKKIAKAKQETENISNSSNVNNNETKNKESKDMSIDEQIVAIKKLKELVDEGILTTEEFEMKKKEILNFKK